ncbi:MAG: hypothetical protein HPPSJP_3230 [Candidatus Hepatoplasma scabrum]|nr:MAG: hypothetical protein HPPSJP_3230 [Candidatus Hepatoplasma sp.]
MNQTEIKLIEKINQKAITILYAKELAMIVFFVISAVFIFSIYQFFFNNGTIKGKEYLEWKEEGDALIIYFWFILSFISSLVGIFGDLFLHRNSKKCFIFYFTFIISYFLSCLILFLWFEAIEQIIVFVLVFFAYLNWGKKESNKKINSIKKRFFVLILLFLLIFTFIFASLIKFLLDDTEYADSAAFLDAFITISFLIGWFLLINKSIEAYIFYLFSTIAAIILSIQYHTWVYLFSNLWYFFLYFLGILNWFQIWRIEIKTENNF